MSKRKFALILLALTGLVALGYQCYPEPDIAFIIPGWPFVEA